MNTKEFTDALGLLVRKFNAANYDDVRIARCEFNYKKSSTDRESGMLVLEIVPYNTIITTVTPRTE